MSLCECGCGETTSVVKKTRTKEGVKRGESRRFVYGHCARVRPCTGYSSRGTHQHGKHTHRMLAERALGHPLPDGAVVHHADCSKAANSPLVICQDRRYHALLHLRTRILRAGFSPNTHGWCTYCKTFKPREDFSPSAKRNSGVHGGCKACMASRSAQWYRARNSKQLAQEIAC